MMEIPASPELSAAAVGTALAGIAAITAILLTLNKARSAVLSNLVNQTELENAMLKMETRMRDEVEKSRQAIRGELHTMLGSVEAKIDGVGSVVHGVKESIARIEGFISRNGRDPIAPAGKQEP